MNPLGLILVGLGLIMFIIGFKGSQHEVVNAFQGIRGKSAETAYSPTPYNPSAPNVQTVQSTSGTQATLL